VEELKKAALTNREARERKYKDISKMYSEINVLRQNLKGIEENVARIDREITGMEDSGGLVSNQIENLKMNIGNLEIENEGLRAEVEGLRQDRDAAQRNTTGLQERKWRITQDVDKAAKSEVGYIETAGKLENELNRLSMNRESKEGDYAKWNDLIWEEYGLTRQAALAVERIDAPQAALHREDREIKAKIREIGAVNVGAVEEHRLVAERYAFLRGQCDDIIDAEGKLVALICELETLMKDRFIEQLSVISNNFDHTFREMFGGGTAALRLTDADDALNSGVDILASPPGKKLSSMSLFSGGERAMTAVALLFAILRGKPSPFCILDEVESALDDANVARYAAYLRTVSQKTQIITITHRKGTMAAADTLYGVTMKEMGVSSLVGVKLE
jgi:chromosome segregation protein